MRGFASGLRLKPWQKDLLSLASGVLLVFAFAPYGLWALGFLAPAALFALWEGATLRRAAFRGLLFGLGLFGFGVSWIIHSVYIVGHEPLLLALALVGLLSLICALFTAGVGVLARLIAPGPGFLRYVLVLPAGWALAEWIRGWILTGFPWLDLGYSAVGLPLGLGYAPVAGTLGVSFVLALTAGMVVASIRLPRARGRFAALGILSAVWLLSPALATIHWVHSAGRPITVSLVQGDIPQRMKFRPRAWRAILARYESMSTPLWHRGQLVVWPESAIATWYEMAEPEIHPLVRILRHHQATLIAGVFNYVFRNQAQYNSAVRLGSGRPEFYDKHHLVPYGEYFPLPRFARRWLKDFHLPYSSFTVGPLHQRPFRIDGERAGISICYEDAFGRVIRRALPEATFLVNISDDAWFGHTIGPDQQFQMARMRALETGRPLARVDNSAITGLINDQGQVMGRLPPFLPLVLTGKIMPETGSTPYDRFGDRLIVWLSLLLLIVAGTVGIRRRFQGSTL
ncbi:MAG: apolipoprotein N-acyltransferase [Gammaproteobacteria bacterium]